METRRLFRVFLRCQDSPLCWKRWIRKPRNGDSLISESGPQTNFGFRTSTSLGCTFSWPTNRCSDSHSTDDTTLIGQRFPVF
jgi:hypothetical protein